MANLIKNSDINTLNTIMTAIGDLIVKANS
jgi:hypothetical protein